MGIDVMCYEFATAQALMINLPEKLDVLFVDVEMPYGNGIEAARGALALREDVQIVLLTAFEEYAIAGYHVQAKRFLLKPVTQQRFNWEIRPIFESALAPRNSPIIVKSGSEIHSLSPESVSYICTLPRKGLLFKTSEGEVRAAGSLSKWEDDLERMSFFRCHTGYLVNLAYVRMIGASEIVLHSGETIPVSKHRRKNLLSALTRFAGGIS